ncbi:hypothetical protein [Nocardioides sp. AE5]|uniref:hypothetical protein n=1 Tax=Nocardioides sp. AE5 TaxID=2962573 RepID=UPI00288265FE|nr:hypothetical protein [Nocardioides sp. AE5]MDT0203504.1 hypothetical protein [Nocardioides sp. AE5]
MALRAHAPHPAASGFTPFVAVTSGRPTERRLPAEQQAVAEDLIASLVCPDLEDLDIHDMGEHDVGYLRVAHRDEGRELITEAWCWVVDDLSWVLLATVDCTDYADFCDLLEDIAFSFEPPRVPLAS